LRKRSVSENLRSENDDDFELKNHQQNHMLLLLVTLFLCICLYPSPLALIQISSPDLTLIHFEEIILEVKYFWNEAFSTNNIQLCLDITDKSPVVQKQGSKLLEMGWIQSSRNRYVSLAEDFLFHNCEVITYKDFNTTNNQPSVTFQVTNFNSGSYFPMVYFHSTASDVAFPPLMSVWWGVLDIVGKNHILAGSRSNYLGDNPHHRPLHSHLHIPMKQRAIILSDRLKNRLLSLLSTPSKTTDNELPTTPMINVVFYFKELVRHGANNRLLELLCDRSIQNNHNPFQYHYSITVITSPILNINESDNEYDASLYHQISKVCRARIITFPFLQANKSLEYALQRLESSLSLLTARTELQQFFLRQSIHILILVNTFNNVQSECLLDAVYQLPLLQRPLVFVELSNLWIPPNWIPVIDAFIAPSYAVGFHSHILDYQLPVFVLYSHFLDTQWFDQSVCQPLWQQQQQQLTSSRWSQSSSRTYSILNRTRPQFEIIIVGRIATEKSIGLVMKTLQLLLSKQSEFFSFPSIDFPSSNSMDLLQWIHFREDLHITIIGNGPHYNAFQSYIGLHRLSKYVSCIGFQSVKYIQSFFQQHHQHAILLNLIINGETFGYAQFEASILGIPVIAFRKGSNAESVLHGDLIEIDSLLQGEKKVSSVSPNTTQLILQRIVQSIFKKYVESRAYHRSCTYYQEHLNRICPHILDRAQSFFTGSSLEDWKAALEQLFLLEN
jgi:glycosyltransferase involved in cell wall biosynthesis